MVDEEGKPYSLKPKQQCCGAIDVLPLPLFHAVVSFICTAYTSRRDYQSTTLFKALTKDHRTYTYNTEFLRLCLPMPPPLILWWSVLQ